MPGLEGDRQSQDKKHQPVDKIDDVVIDAEEILDQSHRWWKL
jgi:hypothetical protein